MFEPLNLRPRDEFDVARELAESIRDLFTVTDMAVDFPEKGFIRFRGRPVVDTAVGFPQIRERFAKRDFTPMLRMDDGDLVLMALPHVVPPNRPNYLLSGILFLATVITTLLTGYAYGAATFTFEWSEIWRGWPFSLSLLLILGAHELGHFFAARYHKVYVSPPYFIPFPTIFGTMGAFIALRAPMTNRRTLFDVGAAGPLCGLVFAIPILAIGLATSDLTTITPDQLALVEGNSFLYALMKTLIFGRFLPSGGEDVLLNQVAWAGWAGMLVTSLNLLPMGQLDGGHVVYSLFGPRARWFYWPVLFFLAALIAFGGPRAGIWWLWILLLAFFGRTHAQPLDDVTPLDPRRRWLAILVILIFIVVFIPFPLPLS